MNAFCHSPPRTVIIVGDEHERGRAVAASRQLGCVLDGWCGTGHAGIALIASLAVRPDLVIIDLDLPDMDGADLLRALAATGHDLRLVLCGASCPRIQDTALALASALGLRAGAAVVGPLTATALRAAMADCAATHASLVAVPDPAPRVQPALDVPDIRTGLLRDEFELYYQPKIALGSGERCGAEALLRWRHPRHGVLAPAAFLPQAEAAGLIDLLTMKVLRMALGHGLELRAAGCPLPISVNLSPVSLTNPDLADQIARALRRSGLPPSAIVFEVTEHEEVADLGVALRVLLKLRLQGHQLSLDDYGAGHASILQMSRIPFSELKLDCRLVHDAWKRPHLEPLLRQAIASAQQLGMTSVAEGIETPEDWAFMRALGCDQAQGYLIARPMPFAELSAWRPDARLLAEPAQRQQAAA
ncbi:EAL domain-containing response regulator [Rugamonas apoptosis]|uniref:EAL domain-containing response regulator n=1 Tax=Rugamonas apoptosis TaxID=2758570 RepID=A0A7W2F8E9_9BURK|nr:EAL domain-containing response regulator [Rugamonas apoptosis]MBA5687043.1 EAL domain-containing response regulator [Rugamonas apoptosis]